MDALNIEEVRLAGKPKHQTIVSTRKTVRYPTQCATLQEAVTMCSSGDIISISPGVYTETVEIDRDLTLQRDGATVNRCSVEIKDMTIAVEEGALAHHPLQCDHADVEMESVECYGGLYAAFAFDVSNITANRCRFHNSYSHGFHLMNSTGFFQNCFFFKNLECGINISGHQSNVRFFRCRSSDNDRFGVHVHTGGAATFDTCDIIRNGYSGVAVTGHDEKSKRQGEKHGKWSEAMIKNCRITSNQWQAVMVLDGSLRVEGSDLRRNTRGALTLACSKKAINQTLDDNNTRLDPEYYSSFQETGEISCNDNIGLLDDGQNQFCFASELPAGWNKLDKDEIVELYKRCWKPLQSRMHGYPNGYTSDLLRDPQARVKVFSLFKQWALEEEVNTDMDELAGPIYDFLLPLGLESFAEKFSGCECEHVHDIIAFTDEDLRNIGMKQFEDRRMVLSRLAAVSGTHMLPKHKKPLDFQSLVEATQFQAKGEELKKRFNEWKKLQPQISTYIGNVMSGPKYEARLRSLFSAMDSDDNAVLDSGELLLSLSTVLGVNTMNIDVDALMRECDLNDTGEIDFANFGIMCQVVLRT